MVSVTTTAAGSAAVEAVGRHLDGARNGSALAPARVICPTPVMAVGLRRALGARKNGVAGVEVTTVNRLAEELAADDLLATDRRVARRPDLLAAVRAELAARPGRFGRVADHRTTEDRLVAFHQELVGLPDHVLERMEQVATGLSIDALRVAGAAFGPVASSDAAVGRRGRAIGGDELIELALDRLARLPDDALGPIVIFNPEPVRPYEGRLIQALARRGDCEVVVGLTGVPAVDERHFGRLAGWSIQVDHRAGSQPGGADRPTVGRATALDVADPEDEVRAALRDVAAHAAAGVALPRMAVLYATSDPYASLLDDQLAATGLPFSGPGYRPLGRSLAGRTLRRLLSLAATGLERGAVITLLSAAPIDAGDGRPAPAAAWNRLSRQAGVIDGDHWLPRLAELAGGTADVESKETTLALSAFVEELDHDLDVPDETTWRAWSTWAIGLLDRYLLLDRGSGTADATDPPGDAGHPDVFAAPPIAEIAALDKIRTVLGDLADLDEVGGPPTIGTFESTVASELAGITVPGRAIGNGLFVGPVASVAGLPFERVIVLGLTEGVFPRSPREDSLLPDQLRAAGNGMLIEKSTVGEVDVRSVALAAAGSRRPALLLSSRGDLRSNRSRSWPRVLSPLVGTRQTLDSHYRGLVDHGRPASVEEFGLRALIGHVEHDNPVHTHELARLDPVLAANLDRVRDRDRSEMTRHAGRVPAGQFDPIDRLLSPTALETYASCPRKYLFQRVLRLGEDDRPERIDEITARDRGTLIHRVLERFVADAIADDDVPEPDQPWSVERRAHLFDLLAQEVKAAEARGVTGGQVKTTLLHRSLITEMHHFLDRDDELRAERRSTPHASEFSFGFENSPALEGLWAGRRMQLRGSVDRVDLTDDGGVLVIDYKGGSSRAFQGMEANPLDDGRRLQLPLYARAVAERLQRTGDRTGLYWLTKMDDIKEMVLDEELEADLENAVGAALDGIAGGVFPGVPGEVVGWPRLSFENCKYCDFDRICPTDRQSEWERVRNDEALTPIHRLLRHLDDDPAP